MRLSLIGELFAGVIRGPVREANRCVPMVPHELTFSVHVITTGPSCICLIKEIGSTAVWNWQMRSFNRWIEIIFSKTKAYIKTLSNTRLGSTYKPDFAHLFILGNRRLKKWLFLFFFSGFFLGVFIQNECSSFRFWIQSSDFTKNWRKCLNCAKTVIVFSISNYVNN